MHGYVGKATSHFFQLALRCVQNKDNNNKNTSKEENNKMTNNSTKHTPYRNYFKQVVPILD